MRNNTATAIRLKDYREPDYWVTDVELDISLDPKATRVASKLSMKRNKNVTADTPVVLDGDELKLISVSVDGKKLEKAQYMLNETALTIARPPKKKRFTIEVITEINPTANTKLMGLYRSGGNYCTQCEAEGFRRITFFPDRPDVLSVYTTRIEANKSEAPILLGNGNPAKKGSAGKGRHYAIWHDPHPKPSYLFALVGGDLGSIHKRFKTASGRPVKLGIYVEPGKEERATYAMDALVRSMRWDEQVFGCEYDLDVFNIVAVSDFNMGAMENKGLNIFNDKYVLGDQHTATDADFANIEAIIAHEYFHNWTGNRITCRDWFQLCLKEGLTVFRDQEFSSDQRSRPVKRISDVKRLKQSQFPEDSGPLAHPVRPTQYQEINNFYTATVYEKGAELVRMIATLLGDRKFRKGMNLYFKRHDGEAATVEEFIACFEQAGKTDLTQFMRWYSQAGTPVLSVTSSFERDRNRFHVTFEQILPATPGQAKKLPHLVPQKIGLLDKHGEEMSPAKITGATCDKDILKLEKRRHKVTFHGIAEKPVFSLNRGFTAPVEVNYPQSEAELAFLAKHDSDSYSRWQSLQTYATNLLLRATRAAKSAKKIEVSEKYLDICVGLVTDNALEPAYRSALIALPNEGELAQAIGKNVDPDAIHKAVSAYNAALGRKLGGASTSLKRELLSKQPFQANEEGAGRRALNARLLMLGVSAGLDEAKSEVLSLFNNADNMTDKFNAFSIIVQHHTEKSVREDVLATFYDAYKDNHIVLDKWFSAQAVRPGNATINSVKKLMKHPDFKFSNPNRLRALLGVFAMGNPTAFNSATGKGYALVAKTIEQLDTINPQVAARMLTAFRSYKVMENGRRKAARNALQELASRQNLSRDVTDILSRTLAD